MKKLSIIALMFLAGCALTPADVQSMSHYDLCSYPWQDPLVPQEISKRKLNCQKVIRKEMQRQISIVDTGTLCSTWYNRGGGDFQDLLDKEVVKRKVDCVQVVQQNALIETQRQAAEAQRLQAVAMENQAEAMRNQKFKTSCTTRESFGQIYTDCY